MMCVIWDMQLAEAVRWCEHSLVNPLHSNYTAGSWDESKRSLAKTKKRDHQINGKYYHTYFHDISDQE